MAEDMLFFKHITMKQPEMQSFPFILSLGQEFQVYENTICVRVCGDSMHPQIQDGDLVQVLKQETAENGDIVVIMDGNDAYVKRFIRSNNGITLEALNSTSHGGRNLIIVLNDNRMSISGGVGALRRSLNRLIAGRRYNNFRLGVKRALRDHEHGSRLACWIRRPAARRGT